jgi:hypothetical protein
LDRIFRVTSRRAYVFAFLALGVVGALVLPALALADCPSCKDLKSDTDYPGGTASLPKGFFYSILLMVSAPFAVAGTFVTRIVLARRRQRRGLVGPESAAAAPPPPTPPKEPRL